MKQEDLLFKLKEFYILEQYQVILYSTQLKALAGYHAKSAYERMIESEQSHVDFFSQQILVYGGEIPNILTTAFTAAGFVTGKTLDIMHPGARYRLGITFENRAIQMYRQFINQSNKDENLKELTKHLWLFLVDEEFHQLWMKEHLLDFELAD